MNDWFKEIKADSELIRLATLISVIDGVIGLPISVRAYKRQVSAQLLLKYSKRIDAITQSVPLRVWAAHPFVPPLLFLMRRRSDAERRPAVGDIESPEAVSHR
jgi:ABC-type phosphate/phosphonate transport system permease subunit